MTTMIDRERKTLNDIERAMVMLIEAVEVAPRPVVMARRVATLVAQRLMRTAGAVEVTVDWRP